MTREEYRGQRLSLSRQRAVLTRKVHELEAAYAAANAPFKQGDTLRVRGRLFPATVWQVDTTPEGTFLYHLTDDINLDLICLERDLSR